MKSMGVLDKSRRLPVTKDVYKKWRVFRELIGNYEDKRNIGIGMMGLEVKILWNKYEREEESTRRRVESGNKGTFEWI